MKKISSYLAIPVSTFLLLSANSLHASAQQSGTDDRGIHVGEDGQIYKLEAVENRSHWDKGKIHPDLAEGVFKVEQPMQIIIHLKNKPLHSHAKKIKKKKKAEIEALAAEVKEIVAEQGPQGSFKSRKEEKAAMKKMVVTPEKVKRARSLNEDIDRLSAQMIKEISRDVKKSVEKEQEQLIDLISKLGGDVTATSKLANSIGAHFNEYSYEILKTIAASPLVESIQPDRVFELDLDESACMLGVDGLSSWWTNGIDGGAYDAALIDSGIRETHRYLKYRDPDNYLDERSIFKRYTDTYSHGTRTAGVMASTHSTFTGMAFGLDKIFNASGHNSITESDVMDNLDWVIDCPDTIDTPEVINNSYSLYYHTTETGDFERFMDAVVDDLGIAVTKSAGNCGPTWGCTYGASLGYPQSYNLISVANLDINDTCTTTDDVIAESSSRGDNTSRRKPDITAPGQDTWSTDSASDTAFANHGGTSAAAPHVAGAIILMEDGGISNQMAQKAVLINTATTWSDNNTLTNYADDGTVDGDRWDETYGWGVMDLDHAYFHRTDWFSGTVVPKNDTAVDDDYKLYKGFMNPNDKVTLVWHRRAVANGSSAPTTYYNLSDLNIRLYDTDDNTLLDSDLVGTTTNVHQVSSDTNTNTVVKVYSWSTSFGGGATSEAFALATEENFSVAAPPTFYSNYSRPNWVAPNDTFDITVRAFNRGDVTAHNNTFTLSNIASVTVNGSNSQSLASILPDPTATNNYPQVMTYSLTTSGATGGTHWLPIDIESNSYAETYTWSRATGVSIVVDATAPASTCTSPASVSETLIPVTWTASDSESGVDISALYVKTPEMTFYMPAGGLSSSGTGGIFDYDFFDGEGTYQFIIRSQDNVGNYAYSSSCSTNYIDTIAPTPDPMTWATSPYEKSTSSIAMTASKATDDNGPVEYNFWRQDLTGGGFALDLGWYTTGSFLDTGLAPNNNYRYWTRARDNALSPNSTGYSVSSDEYTDIETPTGITFGSYGTSYIYAQSTNTPTGLTRGSSGLIISNVTESTSSGWKQNNNLWYSSSLTPNTNYGFNAQARNGDGSLTPVSATFNLHTRAAAPGADPFTNTSCSSIRANWLENSNPEGTVYYCENTTQGTNSGWIADTNWVSTELSSGVSYSFRVKARNDSGVETGWTSLGTQPTATDCLSPTLEWTWNSTTVEPDYIQVMMTPAAADVNSDNVPDIIFSTFAADTGWQGGGILRAISGDNGTEIFSVTNPAYRVQAGAEPAVADIDNDGLPEILVSKQTGELICFEHTGTHKWTSTEIVNRLAVAVADLDQDGIPEIIAGKKVFNNNGTLRWAGTGGTSYATLVADVNLDGSPEVVTGYTTYAFDGTVLSSSTHSGVPAVGNFDLDPNPEIVVVGGNLISLKEHDGTLKWGPVPIPGDGVGAPVVADFDGDGELEIGIGGRDNYVLFETDGTVKWVVDVTDYSSNGTGSSAFDFDDDGIPEIVYSDEYKHRILRGVDGAILYETDGRSGTLMETPLILDVDNDGHVEIVFICNNYGGASYNTGIEVYGNDALWPPARPVWNQFTYHVTNINDNATVPMSEPNNWESFNDFRTQSAASFCLGDFDSDNDVDGVDIYEYNLGGTGVPLADFATSFGRAGCM